VILPKTQSRDRFRPAEARNNDGYYNSHCVVLKGAAGERQRRPCETNARRLEESWDMSIDKMNNGTGEVASAPPWHTLEAREVERLLSTSLEAGLTEEEARRRLSVHGPNLIREERPTHSLALFLRQFHDFMIYVLMGAALISGLLLEELVDAIVIMAIVVANAILGFVQEFRAEKALLALKEMSAPTATVIREGKTREIPSRDLVPGDVILLNAGDHVPADARVLASFSLKVDESTLTGESWSVDKTPERLDDDRLVLAERKNMLYAGTHVVQGRGRAVVVATGKGTEMGAIASMIEEAGEAKTPLQYELLRTGRKIAILCIAISVVVFLAGMLRKQDWAVMFLFSVSLAVAAIPEGLPAIVTISLALGVKRMARENAILRRLPAVETLGCANVICTDKTGTLTCNEMVLREIRLPGKTALFPQGIDLSAEKDLDLSLQLFFLASILCNDAYQQDGAFVGEGTELGLLKAAIQAGMDVERLRVEMARLGEVPFDSERKMMSTLHALPSDSNLGGLISAPMVLFSKGAPEAILRNCDRVLVSESIEPLGPDLKERLEREAEEMAARALRTIALAFKPLHARPDYLDLASEERGLVFLGVAGILDPPRPEVFQALDTCREAHIEVVMITGDHLTTAQAIARELSILQPGKEVLSGKELASMCDEELEERVENIAVYARVSPADKVKIVKAWKGKGKVVAMTGDGVNDAPALKHADIGIAMGITGTDVSKEAADMVLADDNFATIVKAVREGRIIYDNIKKSIFFLLSCNVSSVLVLFLGTLISSHLPMLPVQILWMNLVTNGFPALALGVDTPAPDIMSRPPRDPKEGILSADMQIKILLHGAILSLGGLAAFFAAHYAIFPAQPAKFQTVTFSVLVFSQLLHAYNCRSATYTFTELPLFDNKALVYALLCSFSLQILVLFYPPVMKVFGTAEIGPEGWGLVVSCVLASFALIDRWKVFSRKRAPQG